MEKDHFSTAIQSVRRRAATLRQRADKEPMRRHETLEEAFEELNASLEELRVAEEELRQQNDELLAARQDLEAERERYRGLFEFAPDGYLVTSPSGAILEANRAAALMLGREQRFLVGKPLPNFVAEDERRSFRLLLNEIGRPGVRPPRRVEMRIHPREGEPFDAEITVASIHNAGGKTVGARWMLRDITDRKRAEERLRMWNEELERRVGERTAELQAANRTKDEFLALVSHELRTPLNAIIGWAHILSTHSPDPERDAHAVGVIERNARAQSQLIDDLLEVSRIVTGNLSLKTRPVALAPVIEAAIDSVRHLANENQVILSANLDRAVGPVMGDSYRLQQVVWNLLTNAIKFTPAEGEVHIRFSRAGSDAQISVSDTGRGIAPEFLPYVFDRFRQADSTSTRQYGGLGLGLAIVRNLVKMHGGKVEAMSEGEGRGAIFTVTLPLALEGQQAADSRAASAGTEDFPLEDFRQKLGGLWALVVDDEADTREMLQVIFEQWGVRVTTAETVREALAVLGESAGRQPDLLVADIAMPGENGYDLIRQVRELGPEQGGRIPAIALTAYAGRDDRLRMINAGYHTHVPKPVNVDELGMAAVRLIEFYGRQESKPR